MKTLKALLAATVALLTLSSAAFALPAWKDGVTSPAMTEHDFKSLKSGDQVALICKASNSVQIIDITDRKAAMELCQNGRMINCPLCKKDYKVISGNPDGKGTGSRTKVVAVDESGHPCMFFAKLSK